MNDQQVHDRRWWTLLVLCVSLLVIVMDNSILNVALPTLQRDLHANNSELQWMVDSYTLVFAGLLLTMGSLSDRFGRKTILFFGFITFSIGSAASALANTPTQLTLARAFMGIGGASIMPATLSIITNIFHDPKERGRAIGMWAAVAGLGIALGPLTGGYLIERFYWGSVFLVNLPILAIGLVAGIFLIPQSHDPSAPKLDVIGALLSIAGLVSLVWAIIEAPAKGWTSTTVMTVGGLGILLLLVFAYWEYKSDHPMLDVTFFKNPRFSAASAAITLTFFVLFGALFGITIYMQMVLGYTALEAGARILPYALTMMIVAPLSPRIAERFGTKATVAVGQLLIAASLLILLGINTTSGYMPIFWSFEVMALGMGLTMAPATESIMGSLPRHKAGVGSAVNDTTRQVGGALGVAILGSILNSTYRSELVANTQHLGLPGSVIESSKDALGAALTISQKLPADVGAKLAEGAQAAYTAGLKPAFGVGAIISVIGAGIVMMFLPARAQESHDQVPGSLDAEDVALTGHTM